MRSNTADGIADFNDAAIRRPPVDDFDAIVGNLPELWHYVDPKQAIGRPTLFEDRVTYADITATAARHPIATPVGPTYFNNRDVFEYLGNASHQCDMTIDRYSYLRTFTFFTPLSLSQDAVNHVTTEYLFMVAAGNPAVGVTVLVDAKAVTSAGVTYLQMATATQGVNASMVGIAYGAPVLVALEVDADAGTMKIFVNDPDVPAASVTGINSMPVSDWGKWTLGGVGPATGVGVPLVGWRGRHGPGVIAKAAYSTLNNGRHMRRLFEGASSYFDIPI